MNEIVNKFLLAGGKLKTEMHLIIVLAGHLLETQKESKNVMNQEMQTIFTKMNLIRLVFNMIWLMEILKI